ncbi:proton-coupled folate transporter [Amyelois transitella]|uniref:proton-coupled folate transporter n=1 Tax=Amyelois transitella TaxID=680683 RepID=UPI00298F617B|nr:proton-coupled folate transporter [Amyelois transitella]
MNHGESQFELSENENNKQMNDDETKGSSEAVSFCERINKLRKFITVEPFLAIYFLSNALSVVASQKFITERECTVDLNYPVDICFKIVEGIHDNSTLTMKDAVTSAIGNLYTWKQPLEKFLPAIFILNIGAWSDRTGNRKAIILVPIIGQVFSTATYLAGIFFSSAPIWIISLIDSLILTATGGLTILFSGVYCYVADVTDPDNRTVKVGAIGIVVSISGIIGQLVAGELTQSTGYIVPIAISLICSIFGVLYTYFKIHDVNRKKEEGTSCEKIANFLNPKNFWESFSLLALSKGIQFVQIILILSAYIIILGPLYGLFSTLYNYLLDRYSMNEVEFTWFDSSVQIITSIGTAIGVKLFTDTLKIHDSLLGVIATFCRATSYFIYAFANNRTWLYIGGVSDIFGNIGVVAVRSMSTKIVDSGDIGKLTAIIALADSLTSVTAIPLYNQVWVNYKKYFEGAAYLMGSVLTIPNFFLMFLLYYIDKKQKKDVVTNPDSKEKHVYSNEITAL